MPPKRFASFIQTIGKVEEAKHELLRGSETVELKEHIGGGIYVTLKSGFAMVNIRKYFMPQSCSVEVATKMGIALKFSEWDHLVEAIPNIKKLSPILENAVPCADGTDHCNLMGFLQCRECNPFGDALEK